MPQLYIDIEARFAQFQDSLNSIDRAVNKSASNIQKEFSQAFKSGFGGLVAGFASALSVGALIEFTKRVVDSAAALDDMAETTGATVEGLSQLTDRARISGQDVSKIEEALVRLNKTLSGTDDETNGAGAAFKALGLDMEALKNASPDAALKQIAGSLAGFADGAGKTSVALQIFGRSGAQLLPLLKDIGTDLDRNTTLTADQAAAAERLQNSFRNLGVEISNAARSIVTDMIPSLEQFFSLVNGKGGLSGAIASTVLPQGENIQKKIRELQGELDERLKNRAAPGSITGGGVFGALAGISDSNLQRRIASLKELAQAQALAGGPNYGNEGRLPQLPFISSIAPKAEKTARAVGSTVSEGQRLIEQLTIEVSKKEDLSRVEELLVQIRAKGIKFDSEAQKARALNLANLIDENKLQKDYGENIKALLGPLESESRALALQAEQFGLTKAQIESTTAARIEEAIAIARINGASDDAINFLQREATLRKQIAGSARDLEIKNFVSLGATEQLEKTRATLKDMAAAVEQGLIKPEQFSEAATAFLGLDKAIEKTQGIGQELGLTFSSAFEDAITGAKSFSDILSGLEKDIIRILARKLVTEPLANSVTDIVGNFSSSSGASDGFAAVFDLLKSVIPSFDVGTDFVPRDTLAFIHRGERIVPAAQNSAGGWGGNVVVNLTTPGPVTRETQTQLMHAAGVGVRRALARNG